MILFCLNVLAEVLPFHNRSKMAKVRDFFFWLFLGCFGLFASFLKELPVGLIQMFPQQ